MNTTQPTVTERAAHLADCIASTLEHLHGNGLHSIDFATGAGEELELVLDSPARNGVRGTVYFGDSNREAARVTITVTVDSVTSLTDRTHPDYMPNDDDLAPDWDAPTLTEQRAILTRLGTSVVGQGS